LGYKLEWLVETEGELKRFSKSFREPIKRKVEHFAQNYSESKGLKGVQQIKGQQDLAVSGTLYELDVGSGPRVALAVSDSKKRSWFTW